MQASSVSNGKEINQSLSKSHCTRCLNKIIFVNKQNYLDNRTLNTLERYLAQPGYNGEGLGTAS